jgi:hypothetical protein
VRLASLDPAEFAALKRGGTLLLPVGALAPRGPHLPLSAGVTIAERIARDIAEYLSKRDGTPPVVAHPALPVAPCRGPAGRFGFPRLRRGCTACDRAAGLRPRHAGGVGAVDDAPPAAPSPASQRAFRR